MMNKRTLAAVQKLLQSGKQQVAVSGVWQELIEVQGIGQLVNNKAIIFTTKEIQQLRAIVNRQIEGDVMHTPMKGKRLEMAQHYSNEKMADKTVFGDLIWGCSQHPIPLLNGDATTPNGSFLSFPLTELNVSRCPLLFIIENGEVFRSWWKLTLPRQFDTGLIIYRGHNSNQNAVKELVQQVNLNGNTIGFFDYDPSGICLAHEMGVTSVALPQGWQQHHSKHRVATKYNKDETFTTQSSQLENKQSLLNGTLHTIASTILKGKWALTQEHMLVHKAPLEIVYLNT